MSENRKTINQEKLNQIKNNNLGLYPFFGKFQPDIYIIKPIDKGIGTVEHMVSRNQDILKEFKEIDTEINFVPFIISGTIRFSIRGNFVDDSELGVKHFEVNQNGKHLLTCVWWKDQQFGIDSYGNKLFYKRTISNSGNSGYDYCITEI